MTARTTGDQPARRGGYPNGGGARRGTSGTALRRRADAYREQADALEQMLVETQQHFTEAFAEADSQTTTRDRISDAARRNRNAKGRNVR